eukprot:scaffold6166_cov350-Prasinococcus_capsulatus_cf.AAC.2
MEDGQALTASVKKRFPLPQLTVAPKPHRWIVDLHGMGPSAAGATTLWWLKTLQGMAREEKFPGNVGIVTGWGRHSATGRSSVKEERKHGGGPCGGGVRCSEPAAYPAHRQVPGRGQAEPNRHRHHAGVAAAG